MSEVDEFSAWFRKTWPEAEERLPALLDYASALHEASGRVALVSRSDRHRILERHLPESLAPAFVNRLPDGAAVLDAGSGGGLPAIPLAILRPDLTLTLAEPRLKKIRFLERMVLGHGLRAQVVESRVEDLPEDATWPLVVSRALRWSGDMIEHLEKITVPEALLLRFGPYPAPSGIEADPLGARHGLQVWPRALWKDLPEAP